MIKLSDEDWLMLNCIATTKHAMSPHPLPETGHYRKLRGLEQLDMMCEFCGTADRQYFGYFTDAPISHNYMKNPRYTELRKLLSPREARVMLAKRQAKMQRELRKRPRRVS